MIVETLLPLTNNTAAAVQLDLNLLMNRPAAYLDAAISTMTQEFLGKFIAEGRLAAQDADEELMSTIGAFIMSLVRYHEGRALASRQLEAGRDISDVYTEAIEAMARLSGMLSLVHELGDGPICTEVVTGTSDYSGMISYQGHKWGHALGEAIGEVGVEEPVMMERRFDRDFRGGDGFSWN